MLVGVEGARALLPREERRERGQPGSHPDSGLGLGLEEKTSSERSCMRPSGALDDAAFDSRFEASSNRIDDR